MKSASIWHVFWQHLLPWGCICLWSCIRILWWGNSWIKWSSLKVAFLEDFSMSSPSCTSPCTHTRAHTCTHSHTCSRRCARIHQSWVRGLLSPGKGSQPVLSVSQGGEALVGPTQEIWTSLTPYLPMNAFPWLCLLVLFIASFVLEQ